MIFGARIVKTGIAVMITMYVCKFFNLEPAFFGAVSAVINMQPSILLTLKTARDQFLVHILGVGAGLLFGYLFGGNPLSMGAITIFMIAVYLKLNLKSGIAMGIVAAVFVLSSSQEQFLPNALNRTAVIFAGLSIAMLVNILLWPPRYQQQFKEKLAAANLAVVHYFCRAVREYVRLDAAVPDLNAAQKEKVYQLNKEVRTLFNLLKREGGMLASGIAEQDEWIFTAGKLIEYNKTLAEKADRIYGLVVERYDRRTNSGIPPISNEFKEILVILESGCTIVHRVNGKLRQAVIEGLPVKTEAISEEYWERLTKAIEQWQPRLTASTYYLHALIEAAVTANEIKWATRQGKRLLIEAAAETDGGRQN